MLERYHQSAGQTLDELLGLLDAGWRRGGFGTSEQERQLQAKADAALRRYFDRLARGAGRARLVREGLHVPHGRATRCAAASTASTGCPTATTSSSTTRPAGRARAAQLREDVQLSLYAVGAREAWGVQASRQAYHYVLDDAKVPVPSDEIDRDWIAETVSEVAGGIQAQGFEPTPSYAACSMCDYRIACPAAER